MNFKTYDALNRTITQNLSKIPRDVDLIIGIPRSGLMVASILALHKNLPFTDLESFLSGKLFKTGETRKCAQWITRVEDAKRVVVVDDSISTGAAMRSAKKAIAAAGIQVKVIYCAIYALPTNVKSCDIVFEICNHPRMFEWNYMHHWGLKHACVDIDGVLCEDPTYFENDDGINYQAFLQHAKPKFIPTMPIGYLVTSRLEKYREQTEAWLKKYGIVYDHLIMMEGVDAQTRRKEGSHAKHKAAVYAKTDCFIFIESSYEQTIEICDLAKKPVYCVDKSLYVDTRNLPAQVLNLANDWKITLKRVLRKLIVKYESSINPLIKAVVVVLVVVICGVLFGEIYSRKMLGVSIMPFVEEEAY